MADFKLPRYFSGADALAVQLVDAADHYVSGWSTCTFALAAVYAKLFRLLRQHGGRFAADGQRAVVGRVLTDALDGLAGRHAALEGRVVVVLCLAALDALLVSVLTPVKCVGHFGFFGSGAWV